MYHAKKAILRAIALSIAPACVLIGAPGNGNGKGGKKPPPPPPPPPPGVIKAGRLAREDGASEAARA